MIVADNQPPGTYPLEICATMANYPTVPEACADFTVIVVGGPPAECDYTIVPSAPSQTLLTYPWGAASLASIDLSDDLDAFRVVKSDEACDDVTALTFTAVYQDLAASAPYSGSPEFVWNPETMTLSYQKCSPS